MTLVHDVTESAPLGAGVAGTAADLAAIYNQGCAVAIWRRQPSPGFQSWIDGLEPERLPKAREIVRPRNVRKTVLRICEESETPDCFERERLVADVSALAEIFVGVTNAPCLQVRLDVVTTNACRKFHIDAITSRLVCTYRGTGTQYGISIDGAEPERVFTVPTGAPALLRGTRWPGRSESDLLHRSPPIEGTGETRLVLVLDPIESVDDE